MTQHITHTTAPRTRGRDIHEEHRVATPLELLFDLVFVVAIALAAARLHHGAMEGHMAQALGGFLAAFLAIWWAWMNYTWFASAYDDDSATFRLLTLVQMAGVVLFATGVPAIFQGDFRVGVAGYVVMRLALVVQWLRAARGDPACATTCRRYAIGIAVVQLLWIARLLVTPDWVVVPFIVLFAMELAVPMWAERASGTPWHAHHIAERYGLLVIITLGECVLGATNAVAGIWATQGWTLNLLLVSLASMTLVFSLWWMYFLMPSAEALHHHRDRGFVWGYGHFVVFASAAAIGAALEVVADVLKSGKNAAEVGAQSAHAAIENVASAAGAAVAASAPAAAEVAAHAPAAHGVSPLYAISMVAIAQAIYMVSIWFIYVRTARPQQSQGALTLLCVALVGLGPLAVALGLPLPWALFLLTLGPAITIAYNEHGRKHRAEAFAVR